MRCFFYEIIYLLINKIKMVVDYSHGIANMLSNDEPASMRALILTCEVSYPVTLMSDKSRRVCVSADSSFAL